MNQYKILLEITDMDNKQSRFKTDADTQLNRENTDELNRPANL